MACGRFVIQIFQWLSERTVGQIESERNAVLEALDEARRVMGDTGAGSEWFGAADEKV